MKPVILCIIAICILFMFPGCTSDDSDSGVDPEGAKTLINDAKKALENVLFTLIHTTINEPADVDFSVPHNLFRQAYEKDPKNYDANFGLALTGTMMMTQEDQRMTEMFNDWDNYLNDGASSASSVPAFPTSIRFLKLNERQIAKSALYMPKLATQDLPKLSTIQELIEQLLLPKLDFAITALDYVDNNPDYTFTITGRMQGDDREDALEIDLTEIYALEVTLNVLRSMADMFIAYNVDFFGYDSLEALAAYGPGGSFLTLRNGGASIQEAKSSLLTAIDKLENGIGFLKAETDNQDNDIIKIGPDDASLAELDRVLEGAQQIRDLLTGDQVYTDDWDNDPATEDVQLTVNFGNLFDHPVQDLKAKLPGYTVAVRKEALRQEYDWEFGDVDVTTDVTVGISGSYYYYRSFYLYADGDSSTYENISIDIPRFSEVFDSLKTTLMNKSGLSYMGVSVYFYGYFFAGSNSATATFYYNYETSRPLFSVYLPVITWNANSFNEWIFPDPTLNGFLPGMTDQVFKITFGIDGDDWDKTWH